jgi:hypothetical protein
MQYINLKIIEIKNWMHQARSPALSTLDKLFNIYEWLSGINLKSWVSAGEPEMGKLFNYRS